MIWTGSGTRFLPDDFKVYTNDVLGGTAKRAGAELKGYNIADWPITYADLEPYYERFEWEMGVSGKSGANPFEGPRRKGYPLPPLRPSTRTKLFGEATARLGYHAYETPPGYPVTGLQTPGTVRPTHPQASWLCLLWALQQLRLPCSGQNLLNLHDDSGRP